jgi:hypothetical protein
MFSRRSTAVLAASLVLWAGTASAQQQGTYSWTGYAHPPHPSDSCATYKMTINITVRDGRAVGLFQQEGRPQRNFDLPLAADGSFKGDAKVQNGTIAVKGRITPTGGDVNLDGYCRFGGPLKKT